ncbi:DDE-type integrase/transposase/recombinase [Sulfitobacter sp.]|uniref:DDE-type integrase/transposase/recombinase n=1 Tax=Sulfitobacter sp. TaxID=1903071 RepID=UPI003F6C21F0
MLACVRGGKPAKGHKTYPYLLRGLRVERPNQVWCVDITYIPIRRGFLYLVAIMDWHTRMALSWRISNSSAWAAIGPRTMPDGSGLLPLSADLLCKSPAGQWYDALNEAIYRFGPPDIMNSDQGSQFTLFAWIGRLRRSGIHISMDGKGRYLDNIFIDRLWRTLKYECVDLHALETGLKARASVRLWMEFYNYRPPHKALGGQPPAVAV